MEVPNEGKSKEKTGKDNFKTLLLRLYFKAKLFYSILLMSLLMSSSLFP